MAVGAIQRSFNPPSLLRATNFVGASTAVTATAVSEADGSADALGSTDSDVVGVGAASSSVDLDELVQTIAARTAIPITTIHTTRLDVELLGAATGLAGVTGARGLTGAATTAAGADVTRVVVFLATLLAGAFFAVFLATTFLAVFLATAFLATLLAGAFFAVFLATAFLATAFLVVFFFATAFLAGDFFAAVFFAGDFFAAFFAVFLTATSNSLDCYMHVINAL